MTLLGCCSCGDGTDASAPETNGLCWDCYGTGHLHMDFPIAGYECPNDDTLRAFIAEERRQGRLAVASMMADFALSYGWDFYQRWLADYRRQRSLGLHAFRQRYALGISPTSFIKVTGV